MKSYVTIFLFWLAGISLPAQNFAVLSVGTDSTWGSYSIPVSGNNFLTSGGAWTGNHYDYLITKLNNANSVVWSIKIAAFDTFNVHRTRKIIEYSDGTYIVLIENTSEILRISAAGTLLWHKIFSDTSYMSATVFNYFYDMDVLDNGTIVGVGAQLLNTPPYGYFSWVQGIDINGNILWSNNFTYGIMPSGNQQMTVTNTRDGGFSTCGLLGDTGYFLSMHHFASNGALQWSTFYDLVQYPNLTPKNMLETSDSCLLVVGYTDPNISSTHDGFVFKFSRMGTYIWSQVYSAIHQTEFSDVIEDNNAYVICGNTRPNPTCGINGLLIGIEKNSGVATWQSFVGLGPTTAVAMVSYTNLQKMSGRYIVGGENTLFTSFPLYYNPVLLNFDTLGVLGCYNYSDTLDLVVHSFPSVQQTIVQSNSNANSFNYDLSQAVTNQFVVVYQACTVGIPNYEIQNSLPIYPNPSTDGHFNCEVSDPGSRANIYSLNGDLIRSVNLESTAGTIDLSAEPSGIYLIQIFDSSGMLFSQKVVKE